jgi:hypothetical protein
MVGSSGAFGWVLARASRLALFGFSSLVRWLGNEMEFQSHSLFRR